MENVIIPRVLGSDFWRAMGNLEYLKVSAFRVRSDPLLLLYISNRGEVWLGSGKLRLSL